MLTTIYNGRFTIDFKEKSHRYYVDKKLKQGVTTTINRVVAKGGLMLWPLDEAMELLESRLPVITLKDLEDARQAHIKKRDKGADTGTIVHAMAERLLKGETISPIEIDQNPAEVAMALNAFSAWMGELKPDTIATEQVVYSESDDYAGTFDSILKIGGKTYLCDLKTTNASREAPQGVYAEHFAQLGGYAKAYNEQRDYELANGGTDLVELDDLMIISCKKTGLVHTKRASDMDLSIQDCINMWELIHRLDMLLKYIKSNLGG